jgi:hypothetical protein
MLPVDGKEILVRLIKYALEGSMVAIAVTLIPENTPSIEEILTIALIASCVFSVLDMFAPSIGSSARAGAGFGIGASLSRWPA